MIPEHVLRKMRAALLVAGAAGCTRAGTSADAGGPDATAAAGGTGGDVVGDAAGATDAGDVTADDAGPTDAGVLDAGDAAVLACPFHPEGHAVLPDGGAQRAKQETGLEHIGFLNNLNRDPCPPCGMGGPRPGNYTPDAPVRGDVQTTDIKGVGDTQRPVLTRIMAGQRAGMRACYMKGLTTNPTQHGALLATIAWSPNGEVTAVTMNANGSDLDAAMANCVASRLKRMNAAPELGGATATVRLTFIVQH